MKAFIIGMALCALGDSHYSNPEDLVLSESSMCYYDITSGQPCRMVTYTVANNSADLYAYTWIFYDSPFSDRSRRAKYRYFLLSRGGFSLLGLLTDSFTDDSFVFHELGNSFIKEIKPGESFDYIVIMNSSIPQREVDKRIKPYIYYVLEYDKVYGNYLRHGANDFVFYPESKIVIPLPAPPKKYPVETLSDKFYH